MGTGEDSKTARPVKATSSTQETPAAPSYPDWSMQAYYGAAAAAGGPPHPPFFATTVPSPTPHPYLWGGQHALIPPYGTPVHYPALYPHGGIYPHPSTAQIPTMQQTIAEMESRAAADGKDRTALMKSKGTSGITLVGSTSKGVETGNTASGSGNDGATESAESGSEESSDTNENFQEEHGIAFAKKGSFHQMLVEGASAQSAFNHVNAIGSGPSNLNIGMDLWNASAAAATAGGSVRVRPNNHPIISPSVAPGGGMNASDHWVQDDRELKRQKRKQSNRESARRSRMRKQAECEELQTKVESITNENQTLRDELRRLSEECERLASENKAIKEELTAAACGNGAISKLGSSNGISHNARLRSDKGNN